MTVDKVALITPASRTNQALAEAAGVSAATALRRVKRLVETGVIERQVALLTPRLANPRAASTMNELS